MVTIPRFRGHDELEAFQSKLCPSTGATTWELRWGPTFFWGKPWENHGKTMGKWWSWGKNGDFMGWNRWFMIVGLNRTLRTRIYGNLYDVTWCTLSLCSVATNHVTTGAQPCIVNNLRIVYSMALFEARVPQNRCLSQFVPLKLVRHWEV